MAAIRFQGISKSFPGVVALNDVTFEVAPGACHAVMGENGAGKSTLGRILAGVYTADAGGIWLDERHITPKTPIEARQQGIAIVHQELAFCPNLTVAENLCLGDLPTAAGFLQRSVMEDRAKSMLDEIRADIDVSVPMERLSTAQEQLVQIASAIGTNARVIVMDEPTSSLSAQEVEHLFKLLRDLKQRGITVLYVSHRMEEIFRQCDMVTVLRDGRHISTESIKDTTPDRLVHAMVGREVRQYTFEHFNMPRGAEMLRVEHLSSPGKFADISFSVRAGEIVGFAGLVGAGRSEVAQAIFGLDSSATGRVFVQGRDVRRHSVDAALAAGIGFLPEDRKRLGLVLTMTCRENVSLASLGEMTRLGFVRTGHERALTTEFVDKLRVKTPDIDAPIATLSGGNQQKIALAKWLARRCQVLIVDEPTRGVDVGAKAEIHRLLDELACQGLAIVAISSELPELMNLSGRIIVLREGRVAGELDRSEFSQPALMRLMAAVRGA